MCGRATKGAVEREEISVSSMRKGTEVQQCMEHVPKKHSVRGERLEDKVGGGNICRVWQMQL